MTSFDQQWKKNVKLLEAAQEAAIVEAATAVLARAIDLTPVGRPSLWVSSPPPGYTPGSLRSAWEINYGQGFQQVSNGRNFSSKLVAMANKKAYKLGSDIIIRNQTPYAYRVEYGWSTRQAPQGMLRVSAMKFPSFVDKATKKHKV